VGPQRNSQTACCLLPARVDCAVAAAAAPSATHAPGPAVPARRPPEPRAHWLPRPAPPRRIFLARLPHLPSALLLLSGGRPGLARLLCALASAPAPSRRLPCCPCLPSPARPSPMPENGLHEGSCVLQLCASWQRGPVHCRFKQSSAGTFAAVNLQFCGRSLCPCRSCLHCFNCPLCTVCEMSDLDQSAAFGHRPLCLPPPQLTPALLPRGHYTPD
jgi:hypothetical protein